MGFAIRRKCFLADSWEPLNLLWGESLAGNDGRVGGRRYGRQRFERHCDGNAMLRALLIYFRRYSFFGTHANNGHVEVKITYHSSSTARFTRLSPVAG